MDKQTYDSRREKLRLELRARGLGAILITLDANRYYLSGFELHDHQTNESSGCLVVTADGADWLCTDPRYDDAAKRLWDNERIFIYSGDGGEQINGLLRKEVKGALGFEAACVSLDFYDKISPGLEMRRADGLVEELRIVKDAEECRLMRASCALNHKLMDWIPGVLQGGRTEKQISWDIEQFFRNNGADGLSFTSIVGIGPNAALPHALAGDTAVTDNCCVLIDTGCRLHDYCSDQTRTFWVGNAPSPEFMKAMDQVREAQRRAIAAIKPGAVCSDVYKTAWDYLDSQGVAARFTHGLGHGIGLQTHEPASFNPRNHTVLKPGMVMTVEPGLYYPEWGGIRWEYMALVTEDGAEIL